MSSTHGSTSQISKKHRITVKPPSKPLFVDLTRDDEAMTPPSQATPYSPSPPYAPSKTSSTYTTSSSSYYTTSSMEYTPSPFTPLDNAMPISPPTTLPQSPSPIMAQPNQPHPLELHNANCLCCLHNRNLIYFLRDEIHFMFYFIEHLLTPPPPQMGPQSPPPPNQNN